MDFVSLANSAIAQANQALGTTETPIEIEKEEEYRWILRSHRGVSVCFSGSAITVYEYRPSFHDADACLYSGPNIKHALQAVARRLQFSDEACKKMKKEGITLVLELAA